MDRTTLIYAATAIVAIAALYYYINMPSEGFRVRSRVRSRVKSRARSKVKDNQEDNRSRARSKVGVIGVRSNRSQENPLRSYTPIDYNRQMVDCFKRGGFDFRVTTGEQGCSHLVECLEARGDGKVGWNRIPQKGSDFYICEGVREDREDKEDRENKEVMSRGR